MGHTLTRHKTKNNEFLSWNVLKLSQHVQKLSQPPSTGAGLRSFASLSIRSMRGPTRKRPGVSRLRRCPPLALRLTISASGAIGRGEPRTPKSDALTGGISPPLVCLPLVGPAGWCGRWVTPSELSTAHTGTRLSHEMQTPPPKPPRSRGVTARTARSAPQLARRGDRRPPWGASASGGLKRRSAPQSLALRANSLPLFSAKIGFRYPWRVSFFKPLICKQFSCKSRFCCSDRKTLGALPPMPPLSPARRQGLGAKSHPHPCRERGSLQGRQGAESSPFGLRAAPTP